MTLWRNPEFVRHVRAQLRPVRAITVGLLVIVVFLIAALFSWSSETYNRPVFWKVLFIAMLWIQGIVFTMWCLFECGQAISRERELKTYDFLKTTRLTAGELLVGKLFGAPVLAYFALACSLPLSLISGLVAGYRPATIFWSYALIVVFALFWGVVGLWISLLTERSGASPLALGLVVIFPIMSVGWSFAHENSPMPGLGAISLLPAFLSLYDSSSQITNAHPTFFGYRASFIFLTLFLYASLGAWFAVMLVRNMKKDPGQIRLLARAQAVGLAAYLNLLLFAFLDPRQVSLVDRYGVVTPSEVSEIAVALNALIVFAAGIAMLTPGEKLKAWWRGRIGVAAAMFTADAPPWPWLILVAVAAYLMLAAEALALSPRIPFARWPLGAAALQLLILLVFATRDVLFLQWCLLTRTKRPIFKGFLLVCLYYIAASSLGAVAWQFSERAGLRTFGVLTPFLVFKTDNWRQALGDSVPGVLLQMVIIAFLLRAIFGRLAGRTASTAAA